MRSGTENLPGIASFHAAAVLSKTPGSDIQALNRILRERVTAMGCEINSPDDALPYILNFSTMQVRSQIMLNYLSEREVYVSSGSACAKGALSHTLGSMGLSAQRIDTALRVSFSRYTQPEEIDRLCEVLESGLKTLRR